jgi:hypothetical protein
MRKTGMVEFQCVEGGNDSTCISDQFNEWLMGEEPDCPGFRITHMKVLSCKNNSKQHMETMFIAYEYKVSQMLNLKSGPTK